MLDYSLPRYILYPLKTKNKKNVAFLSLIWLEILKMISFATEKTSS